VFVHDCVTGVTVRASLTGGDVQAGGDSRDPSLDAKGAHVAFASEAADLVPGDGNGVSDVFVRDLATGVTQRVSVATGGAQGDLGSWAPAISADGSTVAFESAAANLVPGDTNAVADVFVRDRAAATTARLSVGPGGVQGDAGSWGAALAADGRAVAFHSEAANLDPGDANGAADVFVATYGARAYVRLADRTRYSTAVKIAERAKADNGGTWEGLLDVVLASGEDRAAADPLAAAGLSWAYGGAPVLLTPSTSAPAEVRALVRDMAAANPGRTVSVHIVGGTMSVPEGRYLELAAAVAGSGGALAADRVQRTGSRYDLAAAVARRMAALAAADPARELAGFALVANGADAAKFFDALALSPIAAAQGAPILLVTADSVPPATAAALASLGYSGDEVWVGGGPNTVSPGVLAALGTTHRLWGKTRYATAVAIAEAALARGWLEPGRVGVAAKLPDALAGGALIGALEGPLLLTASEPLTGDTAAFLAGRSDEVGECYVFGGTASVTEVTVTGVKKALGD
jgi:hypothetical protein